MSRVFDGNSANYLDIFADMVPDYPFTFSLWVKAVDVTTVGGFFTYSLTSSKYMASAYSWTGSLIRYEAKSGTTNAKAIGVTSNSPVNDTWHLLVIRGLDSSTANSFVLDTLGEQVTLTPVGPSITPTSPNLMIGKNGGNGPHDGKIAGMAVWNRYLTDIEVAELEQGVRPNEIAGGTANLYDYWAMEDDSLTGFNGNVLSVNGTVVSDNIDNPPVVATVPAVPPIKTLPLPKRYHPDFRNPRVFPKGPVEIDWSNPLTKGLVFATFLEGGKTRAILGGEATGVDAGQTLEGFDRSLGTAANRLQYDLPPIDRYQGTMVTAIKNTANLSGNAKVFITTDSMLQLRKSNLTPWPVIEINGTANTTYYQFAENPFEVVGKVFKLSMAWNQATTLRSLKSNDEIIYNNATIPTTAETATSLTLTNRSDGIRAASTIMRYCLVWDRTLTEQEYDAVQANVYALLKPATPQRYSFAPIVLTKPYTLPKIYHPDFRDPRAVPIGKVTLDQSQASAESLQAYIFSDERGIRDYVTNRPPASGTGTRSNSTSTKGRNRLYSEGSDFFAITEALTQPSAYTILVYADCQNYIDWFFSGLFAKTSNLTTGNSIQLYKNGGIGIDRELLISHQGTTAFDTGLFADDINGEHLFVFRWDGTTINVFKDSLLFSSGTLGAPTNWGNGYLKVLSNRDTHTSQGQHYLTSVWDRALSDAEVASFSAKPFQLLKPKSSPQYFIPDSQEILRILTLPKIYSPDFRNPRVKPASRNVEIDYSNPLTKDLSNLFVPSDLEFTDLVTGYLPYHGTNVEGTSATRHGLGVKYGTIGGAASTTDLIPYDKVGLTNLTFLLVRQNDDEVLRPAVHFGVPQGNVARFQTHLPYSNGSVYFDFGGTGGANRLIWTSGYTKQANSLEIWAFRAGDSGSQIWLNGELKASQSSPISRSQGTDNSHNFKFNISGADNQTIFFAAMFDTELSDAEIIKLSSAPYQLLKPAQPMQYMVVSSLSASAITSGTYYPTLTEALASAGPNTIILTLVGDTWIPI